MDENEDQEVILNPGMNQEHGLLEDNEDQESEQENEDDDQQTVLQNAQRVREQRRAMVRRTIQEVEEALDGETPTKWQWQKWKFSLEAAVKPIAELDQTILNIILQIPGEDMEAELETVNAFQTDVQMALADIQEALRGYTSGVKMEEADGGKRNVAIKLPKLNLRRFNGDPRNWFPFWDSFEGAIHKWKDLTERDKFDYLKGLLDGEAHDSIANYKMDAKNYRAALKLLAERYGDTERIRRIHYDVLMSLQPVFSDNDVARLRKFFYELETNHRALLLLEKKEEMYSDILVQQIENKLPATPENNHSSEEETR